MRMSIQCSATLQRAKNEATTPIFSLFVSSERTFVFETPEKHLPITLSLWCPIFSHSSALLCRNISTNLWTLFSRAALEIQHRSQCLHGEHQRTACTRAYTRTHAPQTSQHTRTQRNTHTSVNGMQYTLLARAECRCLDLISCTCRCPHSFKRGFYEKRNGRTTIVSAHVRFPAFSPTVALRCIRTTLSLLAKTSQSKSTSAHTSSHTLSSSSPLSPRLPEAVLVPYSYRVGDVTISDPYHWMQDIADKNVQKLIREENKYVTDEHSCKQITFNKEKNKRKQILRYVKQNE